MEIRNLPVETEPDPRDVQYLEDQIIAFNFQATGITDGELLAIFVRDDQKEIVAGIYGWTWGGTCEIRDLWVREDLRGKGLGRDLLCRAEEEATRRGCHQIVLDTHSFQAPGFYRKLGYQVVGEHQDYPRGFGHFFLQKKLPVGPP